MKLEERILASKNDENERNHILTEYMSFIKSSSSKITGRFITESDDEFSVALIAFNEAIDRYDNKKGNFLSYAALVIKSRVTDFLKKGNDESVPFSSLVEGDEEIEVVGLSDVVSDVASEIEELSCELDKYGITFDSLSKHMPVSKKTKLAVAEIIKYILDDASRVSRLKESGNLPITDMCRELSIHKKIPERHRKYIVAAILILSGDYIYVKPYISGIFNSAEVRR